MLWQLPAKVCLHSCFLFVCLFFNKHGQFVGKKKGGRERVSVEGKGDVLINVPENESMTNKNELRVTE